MFWVNLQQVLTLIHLSRFVRSSGFPLPLFCLFLTRVSCCWDGHRGRHRRDLLAASHGSGTLCLLDETVPVYNKSHVDLTGRAAGGRDLTQPLKRTCHSSPRCCLITETMEVTVEWQLVLSEHPFTAHGDKGLKKSSQRRGELPQRTLPQQRLPQHLPLHKPKQQRLKTCSTSERHGQCIMYAFKEGWFSLHH